MANSNVRFYKLPVLPSFNAAKHKGIFVHVTEAMRNVEYEIILTDGKISVNPGTILMDGQELSLVHWLAARGISQIASGLWFGGKNGWELLSNEAQISANDGQLKINNTSVFTANQEGNTDITLGTGLSLTTGEGGAGNYILNVDLSGVAGAMHYKGGLAADSNWPSTVAAGDVYIVTTGFTHGSDALEAGDMIVFNSTTTSDYKVVQSNLTLGVGAGQVAANTEALVDGKIVVGVNPSTAGASKGIKTVDFDVTNLTGTTGKNERTLTLTSQRGDQEVQGDGNPAVDGLNHGVGITDTFKIMGRSMNASFTISSPNRSISIEANNTDAQVDLIWNTVMDA